MDASWPSRPHPSLVAVWRWRAVLGSPLALFGGIVLFPVVAIPVATNGGSLLLAFALTSLLSAGLFLVWAFVYSRLAYDRMTFQFDETSVTIQRGVVFRKRIHMPLGRVQDVQVIDGPLLRAHGLQNIKLQTAAQGQNNVAEGQLPGLADAHRVADALMDRIKRLRGDV